MKTKLLSFTKKHKIRFVVSGLLLIWFYFSLPKPLFKQVYSSVLYDKNSELLGAKIARDGQWRFPLNNSKLPENYKTCLVQFEDEWFYLHPGVNPISLVKATYQNIKAGKIVRGGSTISMQVMRMALGNRPRNLYQKFIELILSLRLEFSYDKDEILNLYAAHAPFGGNVVGLEAAAWRYYGRSPDKLSWGETATLAVLPNAPSLIYPGKNHEILRKKRNKLLDKLYKNKLIDSLTCQLAKQEPLPQKPKALPQIAPHLLELAIKQGSEGKRIYTTIDKQLQIAVNQVALNHYPYLSSNKIFNMGILVNDVENGHILAYMGNMPYQAKPKNAAVDMIMAPRSTGSILKPFLYTWALQEGLILPRSLLKDIPTQIEGYHPKNFDKTYDGIVHADEALARSLNVPAVRLLQKYGLQKFRDQLKQLNFPSINKPADHYGLTLILGGAETRLFDVANNYTFMARVLKHYSQHNAYDSGDYFDLTYLPVIHNFIPASDTDLFGAGNIWFTFKTLSDKDRPTEGDDWHIYASAKKIAWKTGTSFGHRDAWCVGVTPGYTVSVWVGNATGEGRPGLTGIKTAAPVMFDVFKILPKTDWFNKPETSLKQTKVCKQSGMLANPHCPDVQTEYIPFNGERSTTCPYHKIIHLNENKTKRVNSSCYNINQMKNEVYFVLPPIAAWYYKQKNPFYKTLPPWADNCMSQDEKPMALIYPLPNSQIFIPKDFGHVQQKLVCRAVHKNKNSRIYWHLDLEFLQMTHIKHQIEINPPPGKHILTLVDDNGNMINCPIEIIE